MTSLRCQDDTCMVLYDGVLLDLECLMLVCFGACFCLLAEEFAKNWKSLG